VDHHRRAAGLLGHRPPGGCWDTCRRWDTHTHTHTLHQTSVLVFFTHLDSLIINPALTKATAFTKVTRDPVTLHFDGGGGGGGAVVVNGDAGVDAGVLRHQITDLQQDVARVPAEEEEEEEE